MGRKLKNKKKNIWADDYRPYGVNEGEFGNAFEWKSFYNSAMGYDEALKIVKTDNPFTILGLNIGATLTEIKKAFRTLIKKVHPDVGGNSEDFKRVHAAYTVLKERVGE